MVLPRCRPSSVESSTSPDASPTDGWGSSAMLYALAEGLAGVVDKHKLFQKVQLSPRWIAAGRNEATVRLSYGASGAWFGYSLRNDEAAGIIELVLGGNALVHLHLLLPQGTRAKSITVGGKKVDFTNTSVEDSAYVDSDLVVKRDTVVRVHYR